MLVLAGLVALAIAGCGETVDDPTDLDPPIEPMPQPPAPPGGIRWAYALGDSEEDLGTSVLAEPDGSVVAVGEFRGEIEVSPGISLQSAGGRDLYLARWTRDGRHDRSIRYGGDADDVQPRVARSPSGSLVLAATFSGTTDLGGMTAAGPNDGLVAAVTASFHPVWSTAISGFYIDGATATAVDPNGDVIVGGYFAYQAALQGQTLAGQGFDGVVARYSPGGTIVWARGIGGGPVDQGPNAAVISIALDDAGNIFAAGHFNATAVIGGESHEAKDGYDTFLISYDASGATRWVRTFGDLGDEYDPWIAVDAAGNCTLAVVSGGRTTIRHHDAAGALVWQRSIPGAMVKGLRRSGPHLLAFGSFSGRTEIGNGVTLESVGGEDAFVAQLTGGGDVVGAHRFGGLMNDSIAGLAVAPGGELYLTGTFEGSATFGELELRSAGGRDAFVAQLVP